jgi:hypothetical protein
MTQDAKWREKIQNQDWSETGLKDYLLYDEWDEHAAWRVLAGLDFHQKRESKGDMLLDMENEFNFAVDGCENILAQFAINYLRLKAFSETSGQERKYGTPRAYIDWALSKQFKPLWLDWAIEHKLYVPEQGLNSGQLDTTDTIETYTFDPKSTIYPNELELACQAWRAVSSTKGKGTPKERITKWLKDNTDLSNSAIGRISIVANWKKVGGVT